MAAFAMRRILPAKPTPVASMGTENAAIPDPFGEDLERGIHATARQPKASSRWQPATRSPAWDACQVFPPPVGNPPNPPLPPDDA